MEREPSPKGVSPEPTCVERGLPPRMAAPKLALDETMELLSRVDLYLSAPSVTLKAKLRLSNLKKPPPTMSLGVEMLTMDVKSCRGIHGCPMDTFPSPFQPLATVAGHPPRGRPPTNPAARSSHRACRPRGRCRARTPARPRPQHVGGRPRRPAQRAGGRGRDSA